MGYYQEKFKKKKNDFQFEKNVVSVEISGINNNENPKTTTAYNMNILQQISVTGNLIEQVPNSDFSNFLGKTIQLLDSETKILDMIEDDPDFKGKAKKAVRIEDFRYLERYNCELLGHEFDSSDCTPISVEDLQLHQGRPRMSAKLVYLMILVQGYLGSLTNQKNFDFLKESRTFSQ